jgi:DNA polymerase III delta prime subunit
MIVPLNPEILQTEADGPEMFNKETSTEIQNSDPSGIRSKYKELTRLKVLEPILPQKEEVGVNEVDWKMIFMEEVNGLTKEEEELI